MFKFDTDYSIPVYFDNKFIGACYQREIGHLTLSCKINIYNIDNYIKTDGSITLQYFYVVDDTDSAVLCYAIEQMKNNGITVIINYVDTYHGYRKLLLIQ